MALCERVNMKVSRFDLSVDDISAIRKLKQAEDIRLFMSEPGESDVEIQTRQFASMVAKIFNVCLSDIYSSSIFFNNCFIGSIRYSFFIESQPRMVQSRRSS